MIFIHVPPGEPSPRIPSMIRECKPEAGLTPATVPVSLRPRPKARALRCPGPGTPSDLFVLLQAPAHRPHFAAGLAVLIQRCILPFDLAEIERDALDGLVASAVPAGLVAR